MKIICDKENPIMMVPLFVQWSIHRCNLKDCRNKPFAIVAGLSKEVPAFGMCKHHLDEAQNTKGKYAFTLEFNKIEAEIKF